MAASRSQTDEPARSTSLSPEPEGASDMNVSEEVAGLANELQKNACGVRSEIQTFPSGAVWLDVHFAARLFTLAYQPREQLFGVDEADEEEHGLGTHFRFHFK